MSAIKNFVKHEECGGGEVIQMSWQRCTCLVLGCRRWYEILGCRNCGKMWKEVHD